VLVVSRSGYGPARFLMPMNTAPGRPAFEALLQREARVRVFVRDTGGVPAPAVELVLERQHMPDRMSWRRTARTDALGLAVFTEVPVGVFDLFPAARLGVGIRSGEGLGRDNRRVVELSAGADFLAELEVPALSRLRGTIWIGREPLVNARLTLGPPRADFAGLGTDQQRFEAARSLRSDSGGRFGPLELSEGNYALLIEQAELGVRTLRSLRVERGENDVILDVDDTAITGHVGDARGAPLAGVLVRAYVDRPGPREDIRPTEGEFLVPFEEYRTPVAASVTDAQGNYRLRCVPPGRRLELSFSLGRRSIARPRIHVPLGRTLENVNAALPDPGALELVLHAPLPAPGLHHGVRIVGLDQPEGFSLFGASFAESGPGAGRAVFDELVPGRWVVLVAAVDASLVIVEQREPQVVEVLPGKTTEFSVGW
jgi:hypothetical protein